MTNADKVRSMTDKQLTYWLDDHDDQWFCNNGTGCICVHSCLEGRLKWLRQEEGNE